MMMMRKGVGADIMITTQRGEEKEREKIYIYIYIMRLISRV
jgi:hypothetical protein